MARRGKGLLPLFPINLFPRHTNWPARADWISSSDTPSSEWVWMAPRGEFMVVWLSMCTGCDPRRVAFKRTSACFLFCASATWHEALVTSPATLSNAFVYKTDWCSSRSRQISSNGKIRSVQSADSPGQHSAKEHIWSRECPSNVILGMKEPF
jgi:hypothetical protein